MSDFVRFHGSGRVNQVEERFTAGGRPFARLWLGLGGDAAKCEGVVQVDFWGEAERAQVLSLPRGCRALVLGRVSGSISAKGYWNATMFGDAVYPDVPRQAGAPQGGRVKQYGHTDSQQQAQMPHEEQEDIPF